MSGTPILVEPRDGYRVITLNRPQRLNAFTEDMHRALRAAIEDAEGDRDCRALLITGAGRGFCAGQDLNDRLAKPGENVVLGGTLESSTIRSCASCGGCPFRSLPRSTAWPPAPAEYRARLRHRACGQIRDLRAGFCQDRPCSGFRRHLDFCRGSSVRRARAASHCSPSPCRRRRRKAGA